MSKAEDLSQRRINRVYTVIVLALPVELATLPASRG